MYSPYTHTRIECIWWLPATDGVHAFKHTPSGLVQECTRRAADGDDTQLNDSTYKESNCSSHVVRGAKTLQCSGFFTGSTLQHTARVRGVTGQ